MTPEQARRELRTVCSGSELKYLDSLGESSFEFCRVEYDPATKMYAVKTSNRRTQMYNWTISDPQKLGLLFLAAPSCSIAILAPQDCNEGQVELSEPVEVPVVRDGEPDELIQLVPLTKGRAV